MRLLLLLSGLFTAPSFANVEKTIFLAPPAISIPVVHPNLDELSLIPLSPLHLSARTRLNASFPTDDHQKGTEHWFLLDGLSPGVRYEVRICWLATQPTAFSLSTHTLEEVFDDAELISALSAYAYARQVEIDDQVRQMLVARRAVQASSSAKSSEPRVSLLFLRVFVAADYYTLDKDLMVHVPPVLVDIILDPYILNVFPTSLLPTAAYTLLVAVIAWFLSEYAWQLILKLATSSHDQEAQQPEEAKEKTS